MLWLIQAAQSQTLYTFTMLAKSESVSDMTQSDHLSPSGLNDVDLARAREEAIIECHICFPIGF